MMAEENSKSSLAILLVAAGESNRLGQSKQLLPVNGRTLIEHTIQICSESRVGDVYVVLGSNKDVILSNIQTDDDIRFLYHKQWKNGLGSSIAFGIEAIRNDDLHGVIVVLVDQVMLTSKNLTSLVSKFHDTNADIIVSDYGKEMGPPTFFKNSQFVQLSNLTGDNGAKPIVKAYKQKLEKVSFPDGNLDIDEEKDLINLQKINPT